MPDPNVAAMIAIGLPVRKYPFPELAGYPRPFGVVQARNDEFGSPEEVEEVVQGTQARRRIQVVEGTTHLFPGVARLAGEAVKELAEWGLAHARLGVSGLAEAPADDRDR
jgi:alpha/beta superfamily hydrolase